MLCDLHIHSQYSTGSQSIPEILAEVKAKGIGLISITDDDTMEAYPELERLAKQCLVIGVRASTQEAHVQQSPLPHHRVELVQRTLQRFAKQYLVVEFTTHKTAKLRLVRLLAHAGAPAAAQQIDPGLVEAHAVLQNKPPTRRRQRPPPPCWARSRSNATQRTNALHRSMYFDPG